MECQSEQRLEIIKDVYSRIAKNTSVTAGGCIVYPYTIIKFNKVNYTVVQIIGIYHRLIDVSTRMKLFERTCGTNGCIEKDHLKFAYSEPKTKAQLKHNIFLQAVKKDDCWIIENIVQSEGGYGKMKFRNRSHYLHRLVYWIGSDLVNPEDIPKPPECEVRHLCNNKTCILEDHYTIGTASENHQDRPQEKQRGEGHPSATISMKTAQDIADSWKPRTHPEYESQLTRSIAYGVPKHIVNNIDHRRSWPDVTHPNGKKFKGTNSRRKNINQVIINHKSIQTITDGLLRKVKTRVPNEFVAGDCHITNYNKLSLLGVTTYTHRWACVVRERRLLTSDEVARHLCGNHSCINPDHLKAGTPTENSADKRVHGTHGKLKEHQVKDILASAETNKDLAHKYSVTTSNIIHIRNGKTWTYLKPADKPVVVEDANIYIE